MAVVGKINSVSSIVASIKYARDGLDRDSKLEKCVASSGYGIDPEYAEWQIKATARAYGKEKGVQGYSMVTSFKEGEISPQEALEVVKETWRRMTGRMNGDFPCAFYVHGNTKHIHVHSVAGAIDPQTGVKLHQKRMWELMTEISDQVCQEHGLSVVTEKTMERADRFECHLRAKGLYSWKEDLKRRIDGAVSRLRGFTIGEFRQRLQDVGVIAHDRKRKNKPIFMYEFVGEDNKQHKIKDYKLGGFSYEYQNIAELLLKNKEEPLIEKESLNNTPLPQKGRSLLDEIMAAQAISEEYQNYKKPETKGYDLDL